jgi:molecular chaperone GrpE
VSRKKHRSETAGANGLPDDLNADQASSEEQSTSESTDEQFDQNVAEEMERALEGEEADSTIASLVELQADLDEAKDRSLRAMAELENYKKRIRRELDEERRYANLPLMRELLSVWDNMGRAIDAAETGQDTEGLIAGFKMVTEGFQSVLAKHDCIEIKAMGEDFDPNFHEAILQQPSADCPPNTILTVVETGFRLHDRVVRPSRVIVSSELPEETEEQE